MRKIAKGDVVLLRSGGPLMTVGNTKDQRAISGFPASTFALCQWFENYVSMEKWFDTAVLQHANNPNPPAPGDLCWQAEALRS